MSHKKFLYIDDNIKLIIEEDVVGFYLIEYPEPDSIKSCHDYLLDSLEDAFKEAEERYCVNENMWERIAE